MRRARVVPHSGRSTSAPMRNPPNTDRDAPRLQPAGQRWGFGAHSVVPYLFHAATPGAGKADDGAIRNPVFSHMDRALRPMRRNH